MIIRYLFSLFFELKPDTMEMPVRRPQADFDIAFRHSCRVYIYDIENHYIQPTLTIIHIRAKWHGCAGIQVSGHLTPGITRALERDGYRESNGYFYKSLLS